MGRVSRSAPNRPRRARALAWSRRLLSLFETVNLEESGNGVTATAVAPAFVNTDMTAYTTDTVPAESMIAVSDVVRVVDMVMSLTRQAAITRIVVGHSGTSGYCA